MKKVYLIGLIFITLTANAQQMYIPSSFNENRMILKVKDKDGNFVPVEENTLTDPQTKAPPQEVTQKQNTPQKKKFKVRQRDYSIQRSTFTPENFKNLSMPTSSFNQGTMQKAQKDLIKEMNILVECAEDDPNCREYDVDSKGEVLIK